MEIFGDIIFFQLSAKENIQTYFLLEKKAYIQVKFSRILQPANSGAVGLGRVITTLYINNTINEPIFTSNTNKIFPILQNLIIK